MKQMINSVTPGRYGGVLLDHDGSINHLSLDEQSIAEGSGSHNQATSTTEVFPAVPTG